MSAPVAPTLQTIGRRERLGLPDLGISRIVAKVDTGAHSSALHAFSITEFRKGGARWVRFGVYPRRQSAGSQRWCEAPVVDTRTVRSSGGHESHRYFIATTIALNEISFEAMLSLADRHSMGYRMLLGRSAIAGRFLVDVSRSFVLSSKHY